MSSSERMASIVIALTEGQIALLSAYHTSGDYLSILYPGPFCSLDSSVCSPVSPAHLALGRAALDRCPPGTWRADRDQSAARRWLGDGVAIPEIPSRVESRRQSAPATAGGTP